MKSLRNLEDPFYFLMRVVVGVMFAFHGMSKLFGWFGHGRSHEPLMLAAGVIELVCGLFVAVGFFARFAAFLACGEMAVAYFQAHARKGLWPINNGGELAVLYCFIFLFIVAYGGGKWSFDKS
jgi:putative oxidoreductase